LLNSVAVQAGDVVDLPAGRVHALGAGCLVAEVQQNSDLTYRVWDYLRLENGVQRTLHVPQALRALRFDSPFSHEDGITRAADVPEDGVRPLADGASFTVRRLRFSGPRDLPVADRPRVIMALEGSLWLAWGAGQGMMVPWGTTALVPAAVGLSMAPERGQGALLLIEPK
jgi:mannose-6-phosphate isomerase